MAIQVRRYQDGSASVGYFQEGIIAEVVPETESNTRKFYRIDFQGKTVDTFIPKKNEAVILAKKVCVPGKKREKLIQISRQKHTKTSINIINDKE